MLLHNIEDLASAVRKLPPSNPTVVPAFLNKLLDVSSGGQVTDEQVIEIVNNWPKACAEGRTSYLRSVGIDPTPKNLVTFPNIGIGVHLDISRSHWQGLRLECFTSGQHRKIKAKLLEAITSGDPGRGVCNNITPDYSIGIFSNVTFDLDKLNSLIAGTPRIIPTSGIPWIAVPTNLQYDGEKGVGAYNLYFRAV